ncbi:hypothetical protein C9374_014410 [Naegleria lovaniensis]|uniref:Uncharacterized protein n=1 Tax=Naegleria lovaniensis TaxID=51637 RepID=A0AA88GXU4_NAELO|nr:uncharacterized protein C9374_014410 [Naegleria lovaniensis]KAG2389010.1 hypothetical protein C9374_014410 [Naegleria lovaniensis]
MKEPAIPRHLQSNLLAQRSKNNPIHKPQTPSSAFFKQQQPPPPTDFHGKRPVEPCLDEPFDPSSRHSEVATNKSTRTSPRSSFTFECDQSQHPLQLVDILQNVMSFIHDEYFLSTIVSLMCCNKTIAGECLSQESANRLWKDRLLNVTSKGLVDFVTRDLVQRFSNLITRHSKLIVNGCHTLDTSTIGLCEAFHRVTLIGVSFTNRSISDLLGRRSHIQSLTFENCQFRSGETSKTRISSERLTNVSLNNSLPLFSIVEKHLPCIETLECNGYLKEKELQLMENPSFGTRLKTLKLWKKFPSTVNINNNNNNNNNRLFPHILKIEHMSALTSLTIPNLYSVQSIPVNVQHLSLCHCQQDTLSQAIRKPLSHISSLTIYQLSLNPGLSLSTLIKAFCTAFPNLKYLTLPESILQNSLANVHPNSSTYLTGSSLNEPSELCKINILHSANAWPMFVNGLLYELSLSFPNCNFMTSLEKVVEGAHCDISRIDWNMSKTIYYFHLENYFKKIHRWYQLYHDQPKLRSKIDEMRQGIVKLCTLQIVESNKQQLAEILGNLNDQVIEFEGMNLYLQNIVDLRREQLNIFLDFMNSALEYPVSQKACRIIQELTELQNNSKERIHVDMRSEQVKKSGIGTFTCHAASNDSVSQYILQGIEELSQCVKEMENILMTMFHTSSKVLRRNEWYSNDIIEVYDEPGEENHLFDIQFDEMTDTSDHEDEESESEFEMMNDGHESIGC